MAEKITCPHCSEMTTTTSGFCDECGLELQSTKIEPMTAAMAMETKAVSNEIECPHCGHALRKNARHCPNCGKKLSSAKAEEAPRTDTGVLQVGMIIAERYGLEDVLGEGGMGRVWKAFDQNLGKYVVIKTILTPDQALKDALQAEARFLINIRHPNVISVIDFFTVEDELCYVMEYVPGPSWADEIEEATSRRLVKPMSAEQALLRLKGLLPAFRYLHTLNPPIIYCDFKPANVKRFKLPNGETVEVLLDFGTAYLYNSDVPPNPARGTPGYHSPQAQHPDWRDDYFTLGRTLAELTGMADVHNERYRYTLTPPNQFPWNQYDESFRYFVEWLAAYERDDRPRNVDEIEAQLDGVLGYVKGQQTGKTLVRKVANFQGVTLETLKMHTRTGVIKTTVKIDLPEAPANNPAATILLSAQEAYRQRDFTRALSLANQAVNNNGGAAAYAIRSLLYTEHGDTKSAAADLEEVKRISDPHVKWETLLAEGQLLENTGRFEEAEARYQRMMALRPGDYRARLLLADLYRRSGNFDAAIEEYKAIIQAKPAVGSAYIGASKAYLAADKGHEAIKILEEVNSRNTSYNEVMLELIALYNEKALSGDAKGLEQAAQAIIVLKENGAESRIYYRLVGEFYYTAYQVALKSGKVAEIAYPHGRLKQISEISKANEAAWRDYLARDTEANREVIINERIMSARTWAWV